jgi:spore germination protein (amino acid permease)
LNNPPDNAAIGIFPLYSIVLLAVGLMNHVMVIPPLLQEAKRDAWLSALIVIVPCIVWVTALYYIMRRTERQPILLWLKRHGGRAVYWAARLFFIVYLCGIIGMTLRETSMWTHSSYLPKTPTIAVAASLMLLCCLAALAGLRAIAICAGVLLPFVIVFGEFVMSANLPEKKYSLLLPMLENGFAPVLKGSIFVGGGIAELVVLLLLHHHVRGKLRLRSLYVLTILLTVLVLGPVTGAIAEFGPLEAAVQRYPSFEEWRLVTIGRYIRHLDFFSIYQWLSGAFVRISAALYVLLHLLVPSPTRRGKLVMLSLLFAGFVVLAELPYSDMQYVAFLKSYYLPYSLWGVAGLTAVLFTVALVSRGRGSRGAAHDHELA